MGSEMFQVCELEDEVRGVYDFTVAAVPEIWIARLENGSFICYWPKKNPAKKIRQLVPPKLDGSWSTYKCRVLMNGVKFATYEEAKDAEKIGENFSTINFDVSGVGDDDEEQFVANVESKENKCASVRACAMNFEVTDIGDVLKEALFFEVEDLDAEGSDAEGSEKSGYSACFESKNTIFLTSTLNDEGPNTQSINSVTTILSKISTMQKDLHDLKGMVMKITSQHVGSPIRLSPLRSSPLRSSPLRSSPLRSSPLRSSPLRSSPLRSSPLRSSPLRSSPLRSSPLRSSPVRSSPVRWSSVRWSSVRSSPVRSSPVRSSPVRSSPIVAVVIPTEKDVCNQTFVNPNPAFKVDHMNVPIQAEEANHNQTFVDKPVLPLPILNPDHYERNEMLLEEHELLEDALTKHLLPFEGEVESDYMDRTILTVFEENFFLDTTTWKREKNRINVKHSNLVKCWQESYGRRFEPDEKFVKFIAHFRRVKSRLRASQNSSKRSCKKRKLNFAQQSV